VEVTHLHGFAHSLIREFGPLVGTAREARIVTPAYSRQLIRDAIAATGDPARPHPAGTGGGRIAGLATPSATTCELRVTSPSPRRIPSPSSATPSPRCSSKYELRKRRAGVADFADLVTLAHRLVTQHEGLAARIRSRYRLVLLDEYQDTNPGQRELLRAIFGNGFPVTAVGDTDQTIYEWRGASPRNFASFASTSPAATAAPPSRGNLSVSWRNDTAIVTVANAVRSRLTEPGPLPALQARPGAPAGRVISHWAHSAVDEARWLAAEVEALHEAGTPWREIAVLFRKHRQMAVVRDALVDRGSRSRSPPRRLLEVPEVVELHAWLRILGRPDDAVALTRILTGSRYRLGLGDLAPLVAVGGRPGCDGDDDDESGIGWALLEAVDDLDGGRRVARGGPAAARWVRTSTARCSPPPGVSLVELCRIVLEPGGRLSSGGARGRRPPVRPAQPPPVLGPGAGVEPPRGHTLTHAFLDHLDLLADEASSSELDTARVSVTTRCPCSPCIAPRASSGTLSSFPRCRPGCSRPGSSNTRIP